MGHKISIIRNDDERTVQFVADHVNGYPPGQLDVVLRLHPEVPFHEVGAEVARLVGLGHTVVCGTAAARKLTAAGADVSGTVRPS